MAGGLLGPMTQYCESCKTRKPVVGFNRKLTICGDCLEAQAFAKRKRQAAPKQAPLTDGDETVQVADERRKGSASPTRKKCPVCSKNVVVKRGRLASHVDWNGLRCRGDRKTKGAAKTDALDHRLPGSFEGGKRR